MKFAKDYMTDAVLRHELNELTEATFGFDFENWVTNGYYEGDYIPYSFEEDGKILSNVSANIMHFVQNGEKRTYIQIGTVMTASEYRKQGLARALMERVIETYEGKCDGIYLFGDLSALDFYRKMGFTEMMQYRYSLREDVRQELLQDGVRSKLQRNGFVKLDSSDAAAKMAYCESVRASVANGAFEQANKYGLQMFYTSDLENVYYSKDLECFAAMELDEETLVLHSVICPKQVSLERVIGEINLEYKELRLGFTPRQNEMDLFEASVFDGGDDYRLFCMGSELESIEQEKLYFPTFSHA